MSEPSTRSKSALLVIDVQNGPMSVSYNSDGVIKNINTLLDKARSENVPVVWVQHNDDDLVRDSDEWQYVPGLSREESEPLVHKSFGDAFEGTDLEQVLAEQDIGRIVVAGAQTDMCIRSTIHGAFVRGYEVTLVKDAHTTEDLTEYGAPPPDQVIAHTNLYWSWQGAPGRQGRAVDTAEVTFDGSAG